MKNVEKIVNSIIDSIGSKNFLSIDHCFSRIRIIVKDETIINFNLLENKLKKLTLISKNSVQIILGHQSEKICTMLQKIIQ